MGDVVKMVGLLMFVSGLLLAACGGGEGEDEASSAVEPAPDPEVAYPEEGEPGRSADGRSAPLIFGDQEFVSLAVPGDTSTRLGSVKVGVPQGWQLDKGFQGVFVPIGDEFSATFQVGMTCGGGCVRRAAAKWAEVVEELEFSQFRTESSFEIESETDLADGKVLLATNSFGNKIVVVARWLEGRTEYMFCRYSTSKPEVYPRAPFEENCRAAAIGDLPRSDTTYTARGTATRGK